MIHYSYSNLQQNDTLKLNGKPKLHSSPYRELVTVTLSTNANERIFSPLLGRFGHELLQTPCLEALMRCPMDPHGVCSLFFFVAFSMLFGNFCPMGSRVSLFFFFFRWVLWLAMIWYLADARRSTVFAHAACNVFWKGMGQYRTRGILKPFR